MIVVDARPNYRVCEFHLWGCIDRWPRDSKGSARRLSDGLRATGSRRLWIESGRRPATREA